MLRAFRFKITEIPSRLPSFLYKCFIQKSGTLHSLLSAFLIAFPGSDVHPNSDPGFPGQRGDKADPKTLELDLHSVSQRLSEAEDNLSKQATEGEELRAKPFMKLLKS